MTTLTRWNPWREMEALQREMRNMSGRLMSDPGEIVHPLALDAFVNDDEIVITASVPGIDPEHLSISLEDNILTISGAVETEINKENGHYVMRERRYGSFERSLRLSVPVDVERAEAVFDKGVLTLTLPKAEDVKPKQIPVKSVVNAS